MWKTSNMLNFFWQRSFYASAAKTCTSSRVSTNQLSTETSVGEINWTVCWCSSHTVPSIMSAFRTNQPSYWSFQMIVGKEILVGAFRSDWLATEMKIKYRSLCIYCESFPTLWQKTREEDQTKECRLHFTCGGVIIGSIVHLFGHLKRVVTSYGIDKKTSWRLTVDTHQELPLGFFPSFSSHCCWKGMLVTWMPSKNICNATFLRPKW